MLKFISDSACRMLQDFKNDPYCFKNNAYSLIKSHAYTNVDSAKTFARSTLANAVLASLGYSCLSLLCKPAINNRYIIPIASFGAGAAAAARKFSKLGIAAITLGTYGGCQLANSLFQKPPSPQLFQKPPSPQIKLSPQQILNITYILNDGMHKFEKYKWSNPSSILEICPFSSKNLEIISESESGQPNTNMRIWGQYFAKPNSTILGSPMYSIEEHLSSIALVINTKNIIIDSNTNNTNIFVFDKPSDVSVIENSEPTCDDLSKFFNLAYLAFKSIKENHTDSRNAIQINGENEFGIHPKKWIALQLVAARAAEIDCVIVHPSSEEAFSAARKLVSIFGVNISVHKFLEHLAGMTINRPLSKLNF